MPDLDLSAVEFASNPDARAASVLVLDTSFSMGGAPIQELNKGLQLFEHDIKTDPLARRRVELAVVTFGKGGVQTLQDFVSASAFQAPVLHAGGDTPMGAAINVALDLVRARKDVYRTNGVLYYRPLVFLVTDGGPTDAWQAGAQRVHTEERADGVAFFAVGVNGANMQTLEQIAVRAPIHLNGIDFASMFLWLSQSQKNVAASIPGQQAPMAPVGWGHV